MARKLSLLAAFAAAPGSSALLQGERELSSYTFEHYQSEFGKTYPKDEAAKRAEIFQANLALIRKHNQDPHKTWFAAPNDFTDWTNEEFRSRRATGTKAARPALGDSFEAHRLRSSLEALPDAVDWRQKKAITDVKDQGGCGSCWAFSAVETFESHLAISTGEAAVVLSEQQVVSCSPNPQQCGGKGGCDGSTQWLAFNYTQTIGLSLESEYPYKGATGTCQKDQIKPVAINAGYVRLPSNNYTALMDAVANVGPVSISLAAGSIGWQLYGGGVFSGGFLGSCGFDVDHGVQLVGYGADKGKEYWLVRNSWGGRWGEGGYIRILRNGEGKEPCGVDKTPQDGSACAGDTTPKNYCGVCAILSDSSYPTGVKSLQQEVVV